MARDGQARDRQARGGGEHPFPAELIGPESGLPDLATAVQRCHGCELWRDATQAVFGAGPPAPRLVMVGEQPGDEEDRQGQPFVGPAGRMLRRCLAEAGLAAEEVYLTNVVKHFRWGRPPAGGGQRRIHRKPDLVHVEACRPWLAAELDQLRPELTVCLGAVAAQALIRKDFKVTAERGSVLAGPYGPVLATVHPSSLLRAPDEESRHSATAAFVADLTVAARWLATSRTGERPA
jgi:uracil-DNA glycosylase family protein